MSNEYPVIRTIADPDVEDVIALWSECGLVEPWNDPRADIERSRKSAASEIFVAAREDGQIVASIMVGNDGHRGWFYYLAVTPELQRGGLGRRMVQTAETWMKERGVVKAMLMIRTSNIKVHGFYEALGYEPQERVLMARWLDGRP